MSNQPAFPILSALCVGGRARPCHPYADLFTSPTMSPGATFEASSEAAPRAPLWRRRFRLSDEEDDDGPRPDIGEGDLVEIRRRYLIPESVELRCAGEFERATNGGIDEVAIFEAYLEAGFRGGIPSLIAEMSSYFAFSPSQLTPSTWHTLIAIQVLGELHGIPFGVSEILYSYSFVPLMNKKGFYHIWSRDGEPLVNEPPRGVRGGFHFGDLWNRRYVFMNSERENLGEAKDQGDNESWHSISYRNRSLDALSPRNPEVQWTFVLEHGGCMDLRPGNRGLYGPSSRNPVGYKDFRPGTLRSRGPSSRNP
ncbi:hypothetical protein Bca101_057493 [Brassica carinata]